MHAIDWAIKVQFPPYPATLVLQNVPFSYIVAPNAKYVSHGLGSEQPTPVNTQVLIYVGQMESDPPVAIS